MSIFKKLLSIPSGEKVEIEAHDTWFVRWCSTQRGKEGSLNRATGQVEVFPSKEDAERFAEELRTAARLLKDTDGDWGEKWGPWVQKNTYKGA